MASAAGAAGERRGGRGGTAGAKAGWPKMSSPRMGWEAVAGGWAAEGSWGGSVVGGGWGGGGEAGGELGWPLELGEIRPVVD